MYGANARVQLVRTDVNGQAIFNYTAVNDGTDIIVASATVNNTAMSSNKARVIWGPWKHVTFLTLNPSPRAGSPGVPVNVIASLTDSSHDPIAPVVGSTIDFRLDGAQCSGVTDTDGIVTCQITTQVAGLSTLTATFSGTTDLVQSSASVTGPSVNAAAEVL